MFYDDDVFYNENFYIMMNRFKEHYLDFSRFTTGQCIGVFTFKKDNYSFKFDSMLGLSSNFSIRYNDYSNDYEVTLIPCFSNTSSDYYFVKNKSSFIRLDVYNEFHDKIDSLYRFDLDSFFFYEFFTDVISNYSFSFHEFQNFILSQRSNFNYENFELFRFLFSFALNQSFHLHKKYVDRLKLSVQRFLFSDKKNNHFFLNTEIHRFLKHYL